MGGNDNDSSRSDLDNWLEAQRRELDTIRQQFRDSFDKEIQSWTDDASTSSRRGAFERFKNFVDSNFTTFSQGFRNFPANVSELKAKMQQERDAKREEERAVWEQWTGSEDSPDHIRLQIDRQSPEERQSVSDATYMLLREAYERNKHVPPSKIIELFRDDEKSFGPLDQFATPMLSMGGACYYKTETVENLPSTARWNWSTQKPQWLSVGWFKRSSYSPCRLGVTQELAQSDINWRAAFEDLLCATLDKPMQSEEKIGQRVPYGKPQSTFYGPGLDWMLSLQCRGILPPQLPSLYKPVALFDGFDEVKRPRTVEFMHNLEQITANNKSTRMYPGVKHDLTMLMDEIAIKSGPETAAKPLRIVQTPWRVPETEQELYDSMPPYWNSVDLAKAQQSDDTWDGKDDAAWHENRLSLEEFEDQVMEALRTKDYDAVAKVLSAFHKTHGQVRTLVDGLAPPQNDGPLDYSLWLHPAVMEALKRSDLPDDDECKRDAVKFLSWQEKFAKERKEESSTTAANPPSNLTTVDGSKKPDILSQLTTTHTTRMPDGTVTTKVVLKQRFADGSEETHESVQSSRGEDIESNVTKKESIREAPARKTGWFWN